MTSPNLKEFFNSTETFKSIFPSYEVRVSQVKMAEDVAHVIQNGGTLFVEAATGIGKTLAYLIPAIFSGRRVVVSTATKTLQDQIAHKDIPLLERLFKSRVNVAVLKGRQNYLCRRRLSSFMKAPLFSFVEETSFYKPFLKWAEQTETGDREELTGFPETLRFWTEVNSRSELCVGGKCPHFGTCFLTKLKRDAAQADLLVVNHHLFFSDLALRHKAPAAVLPDYEGVIFDEAHRVEAIATLFFGVHISSGQVEDLLKDIRRWALVMGLSVDPELEAIGAHTARFFDGLKAGEDRFRLRANGFPKPVKEAGGLLRDGLLALNGKIGKTKEKKGESGDKEVLTRRILEIRDSFSAFLTPFDPAFVYWGERRKKRVTLHASPVELSGPLQEALFSDTRFTVFTSATLSANGDFSFIRERLGLEDGASEVILPSPFDYNARVLTYIPKDFPVPGSQKYEAALPGLIREIIQINGGKALVLFTSFRQMVRVYHLIKERMPRSAFLQGDKPKSELLQMFREEEESVLFATASFWEGVDIPGEALTAVIIDKLPFFVPDDPLESARMEAVKRKGQNPFMSYQLPRAIISLKQGLGRLMRKKSDRGVLAVLDSRIYKRASGKAFIKSLPPARITHELSDLKRFVG